MSNELPEEILKKFIRTSYLKWFCKNIYLKYLLTWKSFHGILKKKRWQIVWIGDLILVLKYMLFI